MSLTKNQIIVKHLSIIHPPSDLIYTFLAEKMGLPVGQKILIHRGAGGIGSIAIQLAKDLSAHVTTTVSIEAKQFVAALGGEEIINCKVSGI